MKLTLKMELHSGDSEAWNTMFILAVEGNLPLCDIISGGSEFRSKENVLDEDEILNLACKEGVNIRSRGNGCPGHAFADQPWIQVMIDDKDKSTVLIIMQRGGMDI